LVNQAIWKGGGFSGWTSRHPWLINLRHHYWTGTTDDFPRTDGVGDPSGGLRPKPPWHKRFARWFKWVIKGGK
jgi:hypothetical protein